MPKKGRAKLKTHRGAAKRFKLTAKGKVRYKSSFSGHLMSTKSANRRRRLRKPAFITGAVAARIREMLGA